MDFIIFLTILLLKIENIYFINYHISYKYLCTNYDYLVIMIIFKFIIYLFNYYQVSYRYLKYSLTK